MREHAALLRELYAAVRAGRPCVNGWTAGHVDLWLRVLQLPPFEKALEVRPCSSSCPTCVQGRR